MVPADTSRANVIFLFPPPAAAPRVRDLVVAHARLEVGQPVILRIETSAVTVFDT
jgi:hypothetical protein